MSFFRQPAAAQQRGLEQQVQAQQQQPVVTTQSGATSSVLVLDTPDQAVSRHGEAAGDSRHGAAGGCAADSEAINQGMELELLGDWGPYCGVNGIQHSMMFAYISDTTTDDMA